jgi:hypothetical protein
MEGIPPGTGGNTSGSVVIPATLLPPTMALAPAVFDIPVETNTIAPSTQMVSRPMPLVSQVDGCVFAIISLFNSSYFRHLRRLDSEYLK